MSSDQRTSSPTKEQYLQINEVLHQLEISEHADVTVEKYDEAFERFGTDAESRKVLRKYFKQYLHVKSRASLPTTKERVSA